MATIERRATIEAQMTILLNEQEIGALEALSGYNTDKFLGFFYKNLGTTFLKPYEKGLRSLFSTHGTFTDVMKKTEESRRVFSGQLVACKREVAPPRYEPS